MDFNLADLVVTVRTDDAIHFCQSLSVMGKEFAAACRSSLCRWPERDCTSCSRLESCAWPLVFGQNLSTDPLELKHHQKPPLPFVFSFPASSESAEKPVEVEVGLVVIGRAIPHIDLLLDGFAELLASDSRAFSAEVVRTGTRDYQGTLHPLKDRCTVNSQENLVVLSIKGVLEERNWGESNLYIRLASPLRLIRDGRPLDRFDFSGFARSLLRRVSSLAYYYAACECSCDFKELSLQAAAVVCLDDHFLKTPGRGGRMSGITGYGRFTGDFSGLMPFLVAGLYVHAGKGASFGMGRYELHSGDRE